jgi:cytochrome c553
MATATGTKAFKGMTMLGRGVRLAIGSLTLCVASSAAAQGNLDQGKSAAQLYASACATCHKSPQMLATPNDFSGSKAS